MKKINGEMRAKEEGVGWGGVGGLDRIDGVQGSLCCLFVRDAEDGIFKTCMKEEEEEEGRDFHHHK